MMQKSRDEMEWKQMQENARLVRLDGARGKRRKGYVGVRQRASGRWVAEIKDTVRNIRVWLGTFDTSEEAARAYDEAACILRGAKTRTNFWPRSTSSDTKPALPSKISDLLLNRLGARNDANREGLSLESSSYDTVRQGHDTHDTFQISLKTNNTSPINASWTEVEREGGEGEVAKKPRITDYLSLDAIKPSSEYTSLKIAAQEMSSGLMITNHTDKSSMLSEPMDKMKYERSNSVSLYGFNEISECLKLKLGTGDANSTYDSYSDEKSNAAYEADQVAADKQQTSNVSYCSSSNSASSSASIDGNELSLWSSLDLPPITVLFGAQLPSISF